MRKIWQALFFLLILNCLAKATTVMSPDKQIALTFRVKNSGQIENCPVYNIKYSHRPVITESRMGVLLDNHFALDSGFERVSQNITSFDTTWQPVYGEKQSIRDHYNQLTIELQHQHFPSYFLVLEFRCYNAGVAFRYTIHSRAKSDLVIHHEHSEFVFPENYRAWCTERAQGEYEIRKTSQLGSGIERPLTLQADDNLFLAITEAANVSYSRTKLKRSISDSLCLVTDLDSKVQGPSPLSTPWRVIMIAGSVGELLENNDIVLNLNEPNQITDPSWIKPGKVIREVTLTTQGGKACVDFAVKHNLQYVEFDAGWYGNEYADTCDATTVTVDPKRSPGPLDLHEVIRYADERGIGILLYVNRRALEHQLDEILPLYQSWGIKGVKYGFVQVGPQRWTAWLHEAVRKAARHRLMVDIHDEYRPTGYSRTYPNLMTQEGIRGDEASPSNEQTLITLFSRMLAGAGDNTICYYNSRVDKNATHAYQLAKAVCLYSPWQFLYWYDRPPESPRKKGGAGGQEGIIGDEPELEFFDHVPTVWDETRVLHGKIGDYAVIARRTGQEWFVGCMNNNQPRTLDISFDFLSPGQDYIARIYYDDPMINTRTKVRIHERKVRTNTNLTIELPARGGQAMKIRPSGM